MNLKPKQTFKKEIIGVNNNRSCSTPDLVCDSSPQISLLSLIGDTSESDQKSQQKRSDSAEEMPTPLVRKRDISRMTSV